MCFVLWLASSSSRTAAATVEASPNHHFIPFEHSAMKNTSIATTKQRNDVMSQGLTACLCPRLAWARQHIKKYYGQETSVHGE
jgi:hypothetical protein